MGDQDEGESNSVEITQEEQELESKIKKEIDKLQFYLEESNELLETEDFDEIKLTCKRTDEIQDRLNDLVANLQELKIELGNITQRAVRQWKKDLKSTYAPLLEIKASLSKAVEDRKRKANQEAEEEIFTKKYEKEERLRREIQQQEKEQWEQKMMAELKFTEMKIAMEKTSKASLAKLPQLKITPFKGTAADWVRFENMFLTQVNNRPISDEEKFGYLLESVVPKVRDRISNLKPSTLGYKMAWDRLKQEYGQTKLVINAHLDEIINLPVVKGSNYEKVQEFYEKLSKNYDALQTLGQGDMLQGFVMTTLNKLPHVKPDLVRVDVEWENWKMNDLINNLQAWLRRNKVHDSVKPKAKEDDNSRKDSNWFTRGKDGKQKPHCIFCEGEHWSNECKTIATPEMRKKLFADKNLCFNCGREGHRGNQCRSRGCFKCGSKHHTSLCEKNQTTKKGTDPILTGYTTSAEEPSLPAIVPVKIHGEALWAYLDTGSGRNFISRDAAKKLKLAPIHHETREIVTLNGVTKQSMPIYQVNIDSIDGTVQEEIEITGSRLSDFTSIRRPNISQLKQKYDHAKDKEFYMTSSGEYPIHLILGDKTFSRIRTEKVFKGDQGDPIVEETTFGWVIHGGDDYSNDQCMFSRETNDYEKLYSLDVLGVEDRGENNQLEVLTNFQESVRRQDDGRYEVSVPWIPGSRLSSTNEESSRRRLHNVNKKLIKDEKLKKEYEKIVQDQLTSGIVESVPEKPTGERTYYMPHKPVVRQDATTTKVRMVFDASAKPYPSANSINDCMYTGPPLQPLLWDIMVRARMSTNLLLADIQKAFLQIGVKKEDRDSFRFLFNIKGEEKHLRFARVPFGVEASPFLLGATLQHHIGQQPSEFEETVKALKENTYVDNLMQTGEDLESLEKFKEESTIILESAKLPVHKWESNIESLESEEMPNPTKILGHIWDKRDDTLELPVKVFAEEEPVTKKNILSHLGSIYDPLGIISPTTAEGKRIYREACDENKGWNTEVSPKLKNQWIKWTNQLRNVKVPRSMTRKINKMKAVHLHIFADASSLACCSVAIAIVEHNSGVVKGLLTSKSRISKRNTSIPRLELVSGHMAANMAKNLCNALQRWPIKSITIWMDSMVALYWITNPGKQWKVFVSNRVHKIAEITNDININWKYCPTGMNLADQGSRGANINKMENGDWFTGPDWLLNQDKWPDQPKLKCGTKESEEGKPIQAIFFTQEHKPDEWDQLLERSTYWRTMRVTARVLRLIGNCCARRKKLKKRTGPIGTEEITAARDYWVKRAQKTDQPNLESPGWKLVEDEDTGILKCEGRIKEYKPTYLAGGSLVDKLIAHTHNQIMHLGTANTMAAIREKWWIPKLRAKVKKVIKACNVCKVFSTKPFEAPSTSALPKFRTEGSRPFEVTGIDFAGPLHYKISKEEQGKCYVVIFTCAASRAIHLEVTKTQAADEFQRKLNAFIARRTRPRIIISDNAATFKATAEWIKIIRRSEKLQSFLAREDIRWQFNLAKSPWWGGIYERLIKEIKKTLYKTLGRSHLFFEGFESVILDIEKNLNNRPLTYVESEAGEEEVLTPNVIMWGRNAYPIDDIEPDGDKLTKMAKRLNKAKQHAWQRWRREYIHSLMESHRINRKSGATPEVGELLLVVGDESNRGEWKKGRVLSHVKGKDGVVRGVVLQHKGHTIERPLQLVCPLELRAEKKDDVKKDEVPVVKQKVTRAAAKVAAERIRLQAEDEG